MPNSYPYDDLAICPTPYLNFLNIFKTTPAMKLKFDDFFS